MNGMYRVESDNSVDADEPIMKHMTEGGVTILKQLERRKQAPVRANYLKLCCKISKRIISYDIAVIQWITSCHNFKSYDHTCDNKLARTRNATDNVNINSLFSY